MNKNKMNNKNIKNNKRDKIDKRDRKSIKTRKEDAKLKIDKIESESKTKIKIPNYVFGILLLLAFALSLYLRTVMPYGSVFKDGVVEFASDDAVYHMRLIENTLHNFPHQIFYDAFSIFPYGTRVHWGPLFTQIPAAISLIIGLGNYNIQTVNTIAAFYPSILGALVVFPVYYIGKNVVNKNAGIFAAFMIAILPGQFFQRSTLGFTDNHVAEVLFSSATMAFFILAVKSGREKNIKFSDINIRESIKEKSILYSIFAGLMFAAYLDSWPGGPFFALIIAIFILIQYILDDMRGRSTDYLAIASVPMFFINLVAILQYFHPDYGFNIAYYSWFHVAVAFIGMLLPILLSLISREVKRRGYKPYIYPIVLGGFFLLSLIAINIILPQLYDSIVNAPIGIFLPHTGGTNTVAEVTSIFDPSRKGMLADNFPVTGILHDDMSVVLLIFGVLLIFCYRVFKRQRPEDMIFLVWSIIMFLAMYGQNRWAYYFAVNIALMVGYLGTVISEKILSMGGFTGFKISGDTKPNILPPILVIIVILFFSYPAFSATYTDSKYGGGEPSGGGYAEWLNALQWMRNNTPDPGVDYYAVYSVPNRTNYPYPDTAYGVMSWWDYGHIITYWAHRIPNANPFQNGIGGGDSHEPGASTFLTAKTEEDANKVLDALGINGKPGARYIVSNGYMGYEIQEVFATWNNDPAITDPVLEGQNVKPDPKSYYDSAVFTNSGLSSIPGLRYYTSMEGRLHILDGNGLKTYRLVHESPLNPNTLGGYREQQIKYIYNVVYGGNISTEYSGLVKVFEHVKGANITGHASPNTTVVLTNTIKTNIGRTINYTQTTSTNDNGIYEFTVPYSTTGPITGQTLFDTKPTGPYTISLGNTTRNIDVQEKDVLEGNTLEIK